MHIFLDANSIIDQGYGTFSETEELLLITGALGHQIHVPQVALEEVVACFSRSLAEKASAVRGQIGELSKLIGRELEYPINPVDLPDETRLFRDCLENRLALANINIPQYPSISHEEIVNRATSRRRPFDNNGSGYRDTLLWFNILELTGELDGKILLVSRDKDFRGTSDNLHQDLAEDLSRKNQPNDKVVLTLSIPDLLRDHVHPSVRDNFVQAPLGTLDVLGFDPASAIDLGIQSSCLNAHWETCQLFLPWDCEFAILDSVEEVSNLKAVEVRTVPGDRFSVNITCELNGSFEVSIPGTDWPKAEKDPRVRLTDLDSSGSAVSAAISMLLHCELELEIDPLDTQEYTVNVGTLGLSKQTVQSVAE